MKSLLKCTLFFLLILTSCSEKYSPRPGSWLTINNRWIRLQNTERCSWIACWPWIGTTSGKGLSATIHFAIGCTLCLHRCCNDCPVTNFGCHLRADIHLINLATAPSHCEVDSRHQAEQKSTQATATQLQSNKKPRNDQWPDRG